MIGPFRAARCPHLAGKNDGGAVRWGHLTAHTPILAAICMLYAALLPAQVDIRLRSGIDTATVGDYIPLTLSATVPRGSKILWPTLEEKLSPLVVLNAREKDRVAHGDQDYQEYTATIAAYDTGTFQIPPLSVTVITPGESTGTEYSSNPTSILIGSVLPDSGYPEIVDIHSQVDIPISAWEVIWKVAIALGIVGLGYGLYLTYLWWNRRKSAYVPPPPPPIPPHELAYRELMQLKEDKLLQDGKLTEYYFRLSEIIRRYFEGRYQFPALEMASWDIKQVLPEYVSMEELHRKIENWMDSADMVKFAKGIPGWDECEQALDFAYRIVDETKHVPQIMEAAEIQEAEVT